MSLGSNERWEKIAASKPIVQVDRLNHCFKLIISFLLSLFSFSISFFPLPTPYHRLPPPSPSPSLLHNVASCSCRYRQRYRVRIPFSLSHRVVCGPSCLPGGTVTSPTPHFFNVRVNSSIKTYKKTIQMNACQPLDNHLTATFIHAIHSHTVDLVGGTRVYSRSHPFFCVVLNPSPFVTFFSPMTCLYLASPPSSLQLYKDGFRWKQRPIFHPAHSYRHQRRRFFWFGSTLGPQQAFVPELVRKLQPRLQARN